MSSFRSSSQMLKTAYVVVTKSILLSAAYFCVMQNFSVGVFGSDQWIRLCTLTSNGSSLINVTMPCGVHVESIESKDVSKDNTGVPEKWREGDDSVEYVKITLDGGPNSTTAEKQSSSSTTRQDNDSTTEHSNNKTSEENKEEEEGNVEEDGGIEEEGDVVEEGDTGADAEDDNDDRNVEIDIGDDGEDQLTYDEKVTNLDEETYGGASEEGEDQLKNRRRGTAVTKVMLGYLSDARNQLYEKIHYLLNLLQRTFFSTSPICRYRRNLIGRPNLFNNKKKQENQKNPSFSSMILEPTFERSIMTMSFLMFGVFVIQVVQKLMQMVRQPGGTTSFMGNSIFGNLPIPPSGIF